DGAYPIGTVGPGGLAVTALRVVPASGTDAKIQYQLSDGSWNDWGGPSSQINLSNPRAGSISATTASGGVNTYQGEVRGLLRSGAVVPVAAISMESYVRGVLPQEAVPSWPLNALAAQATAARTYAAYALAHPRSADYDICDTTSCQVFKARAFTSPTDLAVASTGGVALTYGGAAALTMFSASNGGWTVSGSAPYLVAQPDAFDNSPLNPNLNYSTSVSAAGIQSRWPAVGTLQQVKITSRDGNGDWGGRVLSMTLIGTGGSVTVSGSSFAGAFGLRSTYFTILATSATATFPRDFTGDGKADLLFVDTAKNDGQLMVAAGDGAGHLRTPSTFGLTGLNYWGAVFSPGAWDGDPVSDVMGVDGQGSLNLWSGATVTNAPRVLGSGFAGYDLWFPIGDFTGNGSTDLIARRRSDQTLWLFEDGPGDALIGPTQVATSMSGYKNFFSPGDFDRDGATDMVGVTNSGALLLFRGNGRGGWQSLGSIGQEWGGTTMSFSPGDLDGDGWPDVVSRFSDGTLRLFSGGGTGFSATSSLGSGWGSARFLR
ncbi:MAG: SpoIID/LytB domain-containing protein, partial [Lapillicoccus sp.]